MGFGSSLMDFGVHFGAILETLGSILVTLGSPGALFELRSSIWSPRAPEVRKRRNFSLTPPLSGSSLEPFWGFFGVLDGFSHLLCCIRFLVGSGVDFGRIFDGFLMFLGGCLRCFLLFFWSRAQNGKLCFDCAGAGGLHVRPSGGTAGRECF